MKPPSPRFGILLAITFVICIFDLVFVWRSVERDLEAAQWQHHRRSDANTEAEDDAGRPRRQQPPSSSTSESNRTDAAVDPEKHRAYRILLDAGMSPVPSEVVARLPRWSDVVSQYGPAPILRGLESCARFRSSVPRRDRYAAVSGLFNTGTNLLGKLMTQNCQIDGRVRGTGMRSQVPWGKHNPPSTHRLKNVAQLGGVGVNQTAVFPMVLIKDPYHWAVSQCRHKYQFTWEHDDEHCPNIVDWRTGQPTKLRVKFAIPPKVEYVTFVGLWNEWHAEYEAQSSVFPLAFLRFEDILFHAEEVVSKLCRCVGGRRRNGGKFIYPEESAKKNLSGHAGSNGLVEALARYGDPGKRLEGWTREDLEYAREELDEGLMDRYGYSRPDWAS